MSLHTGTFVHQFPESDTTGSITEGAESSNGTATQNRSQSFVNPIGSAAARFKIRSAKTLQRKCEPTTKDLRMISNIFEGGKVEDSSQKSDSKDLNKVCTSSASCTHSDNNDKKTGKNVGNGTHKDSALSINSEKGDVSAKQSNIQEEESQTASGSGSGNDLRRYQSNKSKSLDWRGTSRADHGNRTGMTSRTREFDNFIKRSSSFERTGANNKITPHTQENQPSSVSWRIHAYNGANQNTDRKVNPISGSTSVRMNRVNLALEQASSGQSLPVRLKPKLSQGSIGEGSSLWAQQQGESNLDQTDNRMGSRAREQGTSNSEEVTGNQTIMERIEKLFGADAKSDAHSKNSVGLKRNNTSDESFPKSMGTVDSTPSHRKYTTDSVFGTSDFSDSQQGKPSYNVDKARTLPRGFSKTYLCQKQEPSTNKENKNDQRDNSSGLSFSMSSKPTSSTEMSSVKKVQPLLPEDNEETSRQLLTGSSKYCSQSLERTRRLSATAQLNARRNQSACSDSSSSVSSQGVKLLFTNSEGIKGDIGKVKQSDKESTQRLDINENKYLDGLQDGITQPNYPLASKGTACNEIHKEEEKEEVFTDKTEGRRGEGVLEKLHVPSFDSVKNTITMFESLAQQSKSTRETFLTRRTLSVQEHPKPVALVKKSDSDKNLHFGRVVGNTEILRTNLFNKSDSNDETECTLDTRRTPHSNSIVKVRPTLERQETYKTSVELAPPFKQMTESKTEQVINRRDEDERTTVNKAHTDEPDSAITATSGLRNIGTMEEKAGIPSISQQSHVKSLSKQQTINIKIVDDDDENTPTNSPDRPLTVSIQKQINPGAVTVNGNNPKALPNLSQSFTPVQTIYSSLNNSNNNNYETTRKDCTILTTSKARWSSDEEEDDDEETEEDSDSGESSVTITSNMSQSERRSFSLSLVDLCNYGGVDYKPSDSSLSENGEDLPSTRSASLSSDISAFSSVTLLSTDELDRLLDDVRGLGDDTLQKYEDVQVVVLHKEVGSGLGFTLAGGVDQNKPVTVHRVIPGGVAAHEGSIYEGARVLSINGTALQNSAHFEALRTLRKARGQGMAVVVLQSGNSRREATERQGITGRRVRVTLEKSSSDLGFSLEGGVGSSSGDKPLTVQKIFRVGPVSEVFPGDELLEVQGQSLAGMMRLEAWNLIKKLPSGPVEVLLHRPHQPR
ncbi:homeobox-like protein HDP1 [Rhinichthys klamathensis goyatoka]|uniref:homeobox-like protein HDP1 n=1 Tax=Rhinichthys klamathensis goyatoka TaxID=3034132 RepID=UPI0024B57304|nr:homeobox-like protein HDP1 [Rhinichthys klamathensis goyatoka]XP_056123737.1 homeobox-like protein HDP1 [Rhinichthys klamathensis goyatoka]